MTAYTTAAEFIADQLKDEDLTTAQENYIAKIALEEHIVMETETVYRRELRIKNSKRLPALVLMAKAFA